MLALTTFVVAYFVVQSSFEEEHKQRLNAEVQKTKAQEQRNKAEKLSEVNKDLAEKEKKAREEAELRRERAEESALQARFENIYGRSTDNQAQAMVATSQLLAEAAASYVHRFLLAPRRVP